MAGRPSAILGWSSDDRPCGRGAALPDGLSAAHPYRVWTPARRKGSMPARPGAPPRRPPPVRPGASPRPRPTLRSPPTHDPTHALAPASRAASGQAGNRPAANRVRRRRHGRLRTRIREGSRFTIFDIDPVTAEQWGRVLPDGPRPSPRRQRAVTTPPNGGPGLCAGRHRPHAGAAPPPPAHAGRGGAGAPALAGRQPGAAVHRLRLSMGSGAPLLSRRTGWCCACRASAGRSNAAALVATHELAGVPPAARRGAGA